MLFGDSRKLAPRAEVNGGLQNLKIFTEADRTGIPPRQIIRAYLIIRGPSVLSHSFFSLAPLQIASVALPYISLYVILAQY